MARLSSDARGAVYVEFLLAFMPLFILFLGTCQLALITSAKLIVQHSALAAVRSAIVVLDEPPKYHGGAPRGSLYKGRPSAEGSPNALLAAVGLASDMDAGVGDGARENGRRAVQGGARMQPIRTAAYMPLLVLAPREAAFGEGVGANLRESLLSADGMTFALEYTRAASVISVHTRSGSDELAPENISYTAPVTVRVTYFFQCAVPVVRSLMCDALSALLGDKVKRGWLGFSGLAGAMEWRKRLELSERPSALEDLARERGRFIALTGEATLPNQGARYRRGAE